MSTFIWETAEEIDLELANRARKIRKRRGITQQELSEKSGVSYGSIKRFEATGKISLLSLTKIAMELDCIDDVKTMFTKAVYRNIQEVINENK
jgi:transcriptional regulator with XRE-family HTH domain